MEHRDPDYIAARNALIPSAELKANRIVGWTAPKGEEARQAYCAKWNQTFFAEMDRLWSARNVCVAQIARAA
jgi:hypothetical protein